MTEDERALRARVARLRGELAEDRAQLARCLEDARLAVARMATTPEEFEVARSLESLDGFLAGAAAAS